METIEELTEISGYFIPPEDFKNILSREWNNGIDKLQEIWSKIGIEGETLRERQIAFSNYLKNMCQSMIKEETMSMNNMKDRINRLEDEFEILCSQLYQNESNLPSYNKTGTLIQREKSLKSVVGELQEMKETRMQEFNVLYKQEQELCGALSLPQKFSDIVFSGHNLPSDEIIYNLKLHIKSLEKEKLSRCNQLLSLREKITKLCKVLELSQSHLSVTQKQILNSADELLLSEETLVEAKNWIHEMEEMGKKNKTIIKTLTQRLHTLWDLFETEYHDRDLILSQCSSPSSKSIEKLTGIIRVLETQRKANMNKCFEKIIIHLKEWRKKCMIPEEEHNLSWLQDMTEDDYTEENLQALQIELDNYKQYYEENQDILEKIQKYQNLWETMINFENKCNENNKSRYQNRGGHLLKEEKERKKLHKLLPQIENEINFLINKWKEDHRKPFQIFGEPAMDYFSRKWTEYNIEKENAKIQRHLIKETGNNPAYYHGTPSKRFASPSMRMLTPKKAKLTPASGYMTTSRMIPRTPVASSSRMIPRTPTSTMSYGSRLTIQQSMAKSPGMRSNLPPRRISQRLLNRKHNLSIYPSKGNKNTLQAKTNNTLTVPEYSVTYETFKGNISKKMTSTKIPSPVSESSSTINRSKTSLKVIGSKVVSRHSQEGQRRRSLNKSPNPINLKTCCINLQKSTEKLAKQFMKQGNSFQV